MTLSALDAIAITARKSPQRPALLDQDGLAMDYAQLADSVDDLAGQLRNCGLHPEDVAAVLLPASALQVIAVIGALRACTCASLQSKSTVDEVRGWLERIAPSALILTEEFSAVADVARAMGIHILYAQSNSSPREWRIEKAAEPLTPRHTGGNTVLYLVTSGTTSISKIVPLSADNLEAGVKARSSTLRLY